MRHLFSDEGHAQLATALRSNPLMAFDFDGTLAPIVARPDDAQIPALVAERLRAVAKVLPVAIITGRAIDDVRLRLGFEPHYVVGNHGGEDDADPRGSVARMEALNGVRLQLQARSTALTACGIVIEDKRQSIALHYRLSHIRKQARALIEAVLAPYGSTLHVFPGKMVVNVTALHAPHKGDAMRKLVDRSGAGCALFAGDDVNDEPVFVIAPPSWITVRVGRSTTPTLARFYIEGHEEVALMLERIVLLLAAQSTG
ncbi:trehalose-phosphatase [Aquabacterium sp.]|uniref:trehalose-phosphatase n=1 Tax=Aquabacterium sp. TaxID=1872578 RepID=UPI002C014C63|nr:trehalose-phosphatase [Aquabacterium sp.]HSW04634.1 trehalose-phosphatase [Aquabacterium sp.]